MIRSRIGLRIISVALTLVLFISTSGIPIHAIYCACKGDTTLHLFSEGNAACCKSDVETKSCCSEHKEVELPSCCAAIPGAEEPATCNLEVANHPDCMQDEVFITKLVTAFLLPADEDGGSTINFQINLPSHPALVFGNTRSIGMTNPTRAGPPDDVHFQVQNLPFYISYCQYRC